MTCTGWPAAILLALPAFASAQARAPQPAVAPAAPVTVRTWVSQTAVWVGDRVEYVIELRRSPDVEIFLDDLLPEKLPLDGLEVIDTTTEHDASLKAAVVDRVHYTLAPYSVGPQTVGVGAIPVRFAHRRAGEHAEAALPAGEVVVPPLHLGLRSTLTASGEAIAIRDGRSARALPRRIRLAEPVGWALLAIAALPVGGAIVAAMRRARRTRPARPVHVPAKQRRAALEDIKVADVSTTEARRDAYAALDAWIRGSVQLPGGAPAAALTPDEVVAALGDSRDAAWREALEQVLLDCEQAKYGVHLPPADRWASAIDTATTIALRKQTS